MLELLNRTVRDPLRLATCIDYIPSNKFGIRSGNYHLVGVADNADYEFGVTDGRHSVTCKNVTTAGGKITHGLAQEIPTDKMGIGVFLWTLALWVYVGPADYSTNITNSNYATAGSLIATLYFIDPAYYEAGTNFENRRYLQLWLGRGSSTTLSLVVQRLRRVNDATQTLNAVKSSNVSLSKGWHLFYVKPLYGTRSTLVWGVDDKTFSNATGVFNNTEDWTSFYAGYRQSISAGGHGAELPRGPLRLFRNIMAQTDMGDIADTDIF